MFRSANLLSIAGLTVVLAYCASLSAADKPPGKIGKNNAEEAPLERVAWRDEAQQPHEVSGRVLVEAADGGLLLIGQDGRLWTIDKGELMSRQEAGEPFRPLSAAVLGKQLKTELGGGFDVVPTKHYVICTSASREYARWCGALFERLFTSFHNHWKPRGLKLSEPEFPLVAIIFSSEREFAAFATKDAGADAAGAKGYFSIGTNRMVMYDLTAGAQGDIAGILAAAPFNIATVIHEATHQIAFNSGMHTRYADNPLWLVEGMAMYFETPDLSSKTGWRTAGAVNDLRLEQFQEFATERRKPDSLVTLLGSDARFTDTGQMADAYAEAWALSHYLIRAKKEAYVKYLATLAAKPRLVWNTPEERLAEFRAAFGDDLGQINTEMLRHLKKLK
jgi:hypothetical protein